MMKVWLGLIGIMTAGIALAAYSPNTIITDPAGVNQATVKASGTPAAATDKALVVGISPNFASPVPVNVENIPMVSISPLPTTSPLPVSIEGTAAFSGTVNQGTPGPVTSPWPITAPSALPMKAPVNANGTLSSQQTVTESESYVAAPSNAIGVVVECESGNSDNLKWGFSSSSSSILSGKGMLCEPGRDSGYIPIGYGSYLHLLATGDVGTDYADVQWILSQ